MGRTAPLALMRVYKDRAVRHEQAQRADRQLLAWLSGNVAGEVVISGAGGSEDYEQIYSTGGGRFRWVICLAGG